MISLGDLKTIYDIIKSSRIIGDSSINKFNAAFKSAISQVTNCHYGLSYSDVVEFFNSKEFEEYVETNLDFDDLDLVYLAGILENYINIDKESSSESILRELLSSIKINLLDDPKFGNIIISNDLELLKRKFEFHIDDEKIFAILKHYCEKKCKIICDEIWPYDIDETNFVKIFETSTGEVLNRNKMLSNIECLPYINELLSKGPVICIGYYGMGKSTLSKMIFKNWSQFDKMEYPIFLKLSHTNLKDYIDKSLIEQILLEIKTTMKHDKGDQKYVRIFLHDEAKFRNSINKFLNTRRIMLIFDGIDESICSPQVIVEFIRNLNSLNCSYFLTCRLEFNPFFDAFNILKNSYNDIYNIHTAVELLEWGKNQWVEYIKALHIQFPDKDGAITEFCMRVCNGSYSNLPARPLFFKMLVDLEIKNKTDIRILRELDSNLAEIYYKFLKWKIMDDLTRKGCGLIDNMWLFKEESFKLIKDIAVIEYKAILGLDKTGVNIYKIRDMCQKRNFAILSDIFAVKILLSSSLFSIIKRSDNDEYIFSHKSFMEYLIAYNLAECLVPEESSLTEPNCDESWELFQTKEVVQHFVSEIERIRITRAMTFEERDRMISNAFKKVIKQCGPSEIMKLDERIEGVLYYTGKLKVNSPELVNFLHSLADGKLPCNEQYHRTANLALSMLISASYCENYVIGLLNDFNLSGTKYKLNKERSLKYYGENTLKKIMKSGIDRYISEGYHSSMVALTIFTYFTTIHIKEDEIASERDYLQRVLESAKKQKHPRIEEICNRIDKILYKI